jgi:hypothetical protein
VDTDTDADQDPAITDHCAALGDNAHCTLRAALMIANTRAGAHTIDIVALRNTRRSRLRVANPKAPSSDPHCG